MKYKKLAPRMDVESIVQEVIATALAHNREPRHRDLENAILMEMATQGGGYCLKEQVVDAWQEVLREWWRTRCCDLVED